MKQKILSFVFDGEKFLALHSSTHPEHGEGRWFVVTGAVENGETLEEATKREIKEETNLDVKEVFDLNWGSIYTWRGEICKENNFISFVNRSKVKLNEEHDKYDWMELEEFINKLKWNEDKELLRRVLKQALNKRRYFKKQEVKDYRKN